MWKDSTKFLEPNLSGIGGLHIGPTSMRVLADVIVPALLAQDPSIRLQLAEDIRELLLQDLLEHLEASGRPNGQMWTRIVSDRRTTSPTGERIELLEYVRKERESLVLEPNRSHGGDRVLVGPSVAQGEWESDGRRACR